MEAVQNIEHFVNYVVGTLAERPGSAQVTRRESGGKHVFEVKVDDEDVPRLLGRSGNTVMALRNLAIAAAARDGFDVGVEVIEESNYRRRDEGPRSDRRQRLFR